MANCIPDRLADPADHQIMEGEFYRRKLNLKPLAPFTLKGGDIVIPGRGK
jgi:hypothetical protein